LDPLSDILRLLRIDSVLSSRLETRGPHAIRYPTYRHMKFGTVIEGSRWVWVDEGKPIRLEAGDFYLLTNGKSYCVASDPSLQPMDGASIFNEHIGSDGIVRYGNAGELTIAAAGRFSFSDDRVAGLLSFLPPIVHIAKGSLGSEQLEALLPLLSFESNGHGAPGTFIAASSLANLVLVHIIRAYISKGDFVQGWLAAMTDPKIAASLSLMHGDVSRRWTVDLLAQAVGMSRTAFSLKFKERVGRAPLDYLTHWRMMVAAASLKRERHSIVDVAYSVGYSSDTAFSIAFKRTFGINPSSFRLQHLDL